MRENSFEHHNVREQGPLRYFEWGDPRHNISWKVRKLGQGLLRVQTHVDRPFLSITVTESYEGATGKPIQKQASITLDVEHGRSLFEMLKTVYEPAAAPPTEETVR